MSGNSRESLTAALRRLADERASGLLSVVTTDHDVVIELIDGVPVAMGPADDVRDRFGDDAPAALVTTAVVDDLVDRTVAAIVTGEAEWTWDVSAGAETLPVPDDLTQELARRAVDAAQALSALGPGDVLEPANAVTTTGELDRVRRLFDGVRTLEEVATAADRTVPAVATMASALVAGGALAADGKDDDGPEPMSWTDTVAAADGGAAADVDDEDDEPELWVMEPSVDDEPADADDEDDPPAAPSHPEELGRDEDDGAPVAPDDELQPAASTPAGPADDGDTAAAAAASWNDTSWLEELSTQDEATEAPPVLPSDDEDARAALGSLLHDFQDEELFGAGSDGEERAEGGDAQATGSDADDDTVPPAPTPRQPKAEPGDVAEFLRELSRLALDDD